MKVPSSWAVAVVAAVAYPSLFALIGWAIYITHSPWPLLALVFVPSLKVDD